MSAVFFSLKLLLATHGFLPVSYFFSLQHLFHELVCASKFMVDGGVR